jgi:hypothetical protein
MDQIVISALNDFYEDVSDENLDEGFLTPTRTISERAKLKESLKIKRRKLLKCDNQRTKTEGSRVFTTIFPSISGRITKITN